MTQAVLPAPRASKTAGEALMARPRRGLRASGAQVVLVEPGEIRTGNHAETTARPRARCLVGADARATAVTGRWLPALPWTP